MAEANVCGIVSALGAISYINITAPGAEPIVKLLREIPSALQFVLDHPLDNVKSIGQTTASLCTVSQLVIFIALHYATENTNGVSFAATGVDSVGVRYVNVHESSSAISVYICFHLLGPRLRVQAKKKTAGSASRRS